MFHVAAWTQNLDPSGIFTLINATPESTFFTLDKLFKVPESMPYLFGTAGAINTATGTELSILIPSLADMGRLPVEPFSGINGFNVPAEVSLFPRNLIELEPGEHLSCGVVSTPGASVLHTAVAWYCDGPIFPMNEDIFSVRATGNAIQEQRVWKEGTIEFEEPLPQGTYLVVGLRCQVSSGLICRLIFNNQRARPGVPRVNTVSTPDTELFRHGRLGVFGMFRADLPPNIEMLNGTATAQNLILDLVRF